MYRRGKYRASQTKVQLTVTNFFGSSTWLYWESSQGQTDSDSSMLYLKDCHTLCWIELLTVSFYNKKLIEVNIKYLLWQLTSLAYLPEAPLHTGTFCTKSHISMLYTDLDWGLCSQNWDMKTITSFHSQYTHTKRHNRRRDTCGIAWTCMLFHIELTLKSCVVSAKWTILSPFTKEYRARATHSSIT